MADSGPWDDFKSSAGPWSDFKPAAKPALSSTPIGDLPPDFGSAQVKPQELPASFNEFAQKIGGLPKPEDVLPALGDAFKENAVSMLKPWEAFSGVASPGADVARAAASKLVPVAPVASGLAGIVQGLGNELVPAYGGTPDKSPADAANDMAQRLTYEPKTGAGKFAGAAIDLPFELFGNLTRGVGEKVQDVTGSPVAATAADTALQALPFLFGGREAAKATKPPAKVFTEELKTGATDGMPTGSDLMQQVTASIRGKLQEADQAAQQQAPAAPAPKPEQPNGRGPEQRRPETGPVAKQPGAGVPATGGDQLPDQIQSPQAAAGSADPAAPLHPWTPVDTQSAVPLAGGVAHEAGGPEVVIDKRMPASVDVPHPDGGTVAVDAHEAVGLHERTEWPLMHLDGPVDEAGIAALRERAGGADIPEAVLDKLRRGEPLDYAEAHDIATKTENHHVRTKYGVEPEHYQKALTDGIEAAKKEAPTDPGVRPTLDAKPYVDDGQTHLLEAQKPEAPKPADRIQELRKARDDGTATTEQLHELSRLQDEAAHAADVGGTVIPGVLNSRGRAALEQSGKMKRFRIKTDLDDFKDINDTLGHDVGDEALRAKAEAMRQAFGDGNSWREGGDEFGAHADTEEEAHAKMAQVREALKGTKLVGEDANGNPIAERRIGVSYGVGEGETHTLAAKAADRALYVDKAARKAAGERIGQRKTDPANAQGMGAGSPPEGRGEVPPGAGQEVTDAPARSAEPTSGARQSEPDVAGAGVNGDARPVSESVGAGDARADVGGAQSDSPREPIGIKNSSVEADRIARGVDAIASEEGPSHAESWQRAKDTAAKDPDAGRRLTQAILDGEKKALTQDEVALLLHDRVRISNEYRAAMEAHDAATTDLDKTQALLRLREAERQMDANDLADRKSGTENALGLSARQMLANEDYSLARIGQRLKIAEGVDSVEKLPAAVKERMNALVKELDEANKQIEQLKQSRQRGPKKTVDQRAQEKLSRQMADLEKTIQERLSACPI